MDTLSGRAIKQKKRAVLLVEAIVASFLMLFAFIASTQLFEAALRWESAGTNVRLAAIVAERRMEDIRQWAAVNRNNLPAAWASLSTAFPLSYPDAPGFEITQEGSLPVHTPNPNRPPAEQLAPDGFFSPTSHVYFPPPVSPPAPAPAVSAQKDLEWQSYPHVRNFDDSLRQVKVTVTYGTGGTQEFEMISVVADPVYRDVVPQVVITGSPILNAGSAADYTVTVSRGGNPVSNVTALWSVAPASASPVITALDPAARQVRVARGALPSGSNVILAAKVRFAGREYVGFSNPIACP